MEIKDLITSRICGNTVFENSWLWYCDECRQHGTTTSSDEADFMAQQHALYNSYLVELDVDGEEVELEEDEEPIMYAEYPEDERSSVSWSLDCEPALYIIDEGNNITYNYGDDYNDKTPNKVVDLGVMIEAQKRLGLE